MYSDVNANKNHQTHWYIFCDAAWIVLWHMERHCWRMFRRVVWTYFRPMYWQRLDILYPYRGCDIFWHIFHSNSIFLTYFYVIRQFGHGTLHFRTSAALPSLFSYGSMSGFGIRNGVRPLWSTRSTPAISGRFTPRIPPFFCSASAFVGDPPPLVEKHM